MFLTTTNLVFLSTEMIEVKFFKHHHFVVFRLVSMVDSSLLSRFSTRAHLTMFRGASELLHEPHPNVEKKSYAEQ